MSDGACDWDTVRVTTTISVEVALSVEACVDVKDNTCDADAPMLKVCELDVA